MRALLQRKYFLTLLAGDALTLLLVTLFGFASHQGIAAAGTRMLTTFLPLVAAWLVTAPFLGVYDPERASDMGQLWRPFWAMVLAGPMASWLRGTLLGSPIIPIFVVVLGGISALAILAWRILFGLWVSRKRLSYGRS